MFSKIRGFFMIILSLSLVVPLYSFTSGDGSIGNPYIVHTCYDLDNISNYLSSNFTQGSDIDCSVYGTGSGFDPIGGVFTGSYDGNGSLISNLFINQSEGSYIGLFNQTSSSIIINVNLVNIDIIGNTRVGGLVGRSFSSSYISNSSSSGDIYGNIRVGGLVGTSSSLSIFNSSSTSDVTGNDEVGGLVGYSHTSSISNSYSSGTISGIDKIGGLVGDTFANTISNSYSTSDVNGNISVGGLVGVSAMSSSISNSFATGYVIGNSIVGGLVGDLFSSSISNSYSSGNVRGNNTVGGLIGDYSAGTIINTFWNNHTGNVNNTFGIGSTTGTNVIQNNISYFYGNSSLPMSSWDSNIWDFNNNSLPHLDFENYNFPSSTPTPSDALSITSLPALNFVTILASISMILFYLF